jgi:molecular chaperone DnaK
VGKAIGIDLGTSNSCVAVVIDGTPVVIPDDKGRNTTPSVIRYEDGKVVVGHEAKSGLAKQHDQTLYSVKRLIGRKTFSAEVKKARKVMPYGIVDGENDSVLVEVGGEAKAIPEVSAQVLRKMKKIAEDYLGEEVTDAVITVPAYFNDGQRQATKDAGVIAGLNVLRIINEPTAAALAYGYGRDVEQKVAIYDLGGGTFDVSILEIGEDVFEVLATAGDSYLGGDDFDDRVVDFLADQFQDQFKINPRSDIAALQRLKLLAEDTKIRLSHEEVIEILAPLMEHEGKRLAVKTKIARKNFDQLTFDLMQRTFKVCDEALQQAHLTVRDLDGIILVGGSTKMPVVRKMTEQYFFKQPDTNINPDEVVAVGAAVQASILKGEVENSLLLDVTSHSLGIQTVGDRMEVLVPANAAIPLEETKTFTTGRDNQETVRVKIYQGEESIASENELLGELILDGIQPAPRGTPKISVRFEISPEGIVSVHASDMDTGLEKSAKLAISGGMDELQVQKATTDASEFVIE